MVFFVRKKEKSYGFTRIFIQESADCYPVCQNDGMSQTNNICHKKRKNKMQSLVCRRDFKINRRASGRIKLHDERYRNNTMMTRIQTVKLLLGDLVEIEFQEKKDRLKIKIESAWYTKDHVEEIVKALQEFLDTGKI